MAEKRRSPLLLEVYSCPSFSVNVNGARGCQRTRSRSRRASPPACTVQYTLIIVITRRLPPPWRTCTLITRACACKPRPPSLMALTHSLQQASMPPRLDPWLHRRPLSTASASESAQPVPCSSKHSALHRFRLDHPSWPRHLHACSTIYQQRHAVRPWPSRTQTHCVLAAPT